MDLAITYACNNNCSHCYNARSRNFPHLSLDEWKKVLDTLWEIGVPHVVFTGGEPTLVEFLPDLIRHAESNGQITGINTNGRKLKDGNLCPVLVNAGLIMSRLHSNPTIREFTTRWFSVRCLAGYLTGIRNVFHPVVRMMTNSTCMSPTELAILEGNA